MTLTPRSTRKSGIWTAHLKDEKEIQELESAMKGLQHSIVLKRLLEIISQDRESAAKAALSTRNYESPSWGYIQADSTGYQRALLTIETLLKGFVKA